MAAIHLGALQIWSPAFDNDARIPDRHTAKGEDIPPELRFEAVPAGARSLAVVCHDPDAPLTYGFDHWVAYDLPPDRTGLTPGPDPHVTEGLNSFGTPGYRGPAPPPGHGVHHYYFHLYALDAELHAASGLTGRALLDQIDEHIIEQARLVGTYSVEAA